MQLEEDSTVAVALNLVSVGLAEKKEHGYLRLDPALSSHLRIGQTPEKLSTLEADWAQAMVQMTESLYQNRGQDSNMASSLTLLELPNIVALLNWISQRRAEDGDVARQTASTAGSIEQLLESVNRPDALAQAVTLRKQAAESISEWGHARFMNEELQIERFLDSGYLSIAHEKAEALLEKAKSTEITFYKEAGYDLAVAHWLLGRALKTGSYAQSAYPLFVEAEQLFEKFEEGGIRMAILSLTEQADCFTFLGRLDESTVIYETCIQRSEKLENARQVAVCSGQLATVYKMQGKYDRAVAGYKKAQTLFKDQNNHAAVAISLHQLGTVYQESKQYDQAEIAYRQALEINTRISNLAGQAANLTQLGLLYSNHLSQLEDALAFYKQAIDIFISQGDRRFEGVARNNAATILLKLGFHNEAQVEILRAIECIKKFGHAAEPWKSFCTLYDIETAAGSLASARAARQQAQNAYLAYRQQGGYAQYEGGKLAEQIWTKVQQEVLNSVIQWLTQIKSDTNTLNLSKHFMQKLSAVLKGSRDSSLANDDELDYEESAEILLLIQRFDLLEE